MIVDKFSQALAGKGIELNSEQLSQFEKYYQILVEWNEHTNLTAITERDEVYLKHFYDSLMPLWLAEDKFEEEGLKLADVGAGAGFPSIPLKIVRPDIELVIIDSLNKRINFLNHLVAELGLSGVTPVHARAEEAGQNPDYRGQFDLVTARAVAALNVLSEYCLPLVKKGGYFIALKGQGGQEEVNDAENALRMLGAKFEGIEIEDLPNNGGERSIITIRQALDMPKKYPRRAGQPSKKPL